MKVGQNRKDLASAIALHAGAKRELRVAEEAAGQARGRYYDAISKLEILREAPSLAGALADAFIASVSSAEPCNVAVLEKSKVDAHAQIKAAENEVMIWEQTAEECDQAVRAKEADVATAKERVEKAARVVICNAETVKRQQAPA